MTHPYRTQPARAFWSRTVSKDFRAADTFASRSPLLRSGDLVTSAGSCFASNMVPFLEQNGFRYVRTETPHRACPEFEADNFGYSNFSASYGHIYTSRQLAQLISRCTGKFIPVEDRWITANSVLDPFRPGLRFPARSEIEFEALRRQHFAKTLEAFRTADVFVFTLGLTEAWTSRADGAVFPACPGTIGGVFDPERHILHNFTVAEVVLDLNIAIESLRAINPTLRFILTVSPVPLVATATNGHVLTASIYSKSVLRVAAEEIACTVKEVTYFPSYEIITGPQAPYEFYEPDRRNVSQAGIQEVMAAFIANCEKNDPSNSPAPAPAADYSRILSSLVVDAECEELMSDRGTN